MVRSFLSDVIQIFDEPLIEVSEVDFTHNIINII